jgi:glyoxalase family protein
VNHSVLGIHHVTAIASDPQRNLDFYTEVLGLRLVKRTVNFDDLGTYHLYFGDELGSPWGNSNLLPLADGCPREPRRGTSDGDVVQHPRTFRGLLGAPATFIRHARGKIREAI